MLLRLPDAVSLLIIYYKESLIDDVAALSDVSLIDDDFEHCVEQILEARGRVVTTVIGKSAIIAQKIVAT